MATWRVVSARSSIESAEYVDPFDALFLKVVARERAS
jgi:hypothetical protein